MTDYNILVGAKKDLYYGWESTFGTEATTLNKDFGRNVRFSWSEKRNPFTVADLSSRKPVDFVEMRHEVGIGLEGVVTNGYWWKFLLKDVTVTGTGPYTHTYALDESPVPQSATIYLNDRDESKLWKFLGVVIGSMSLSSTVGDAVKFRMDGFAQKHESGTAVSQPTLIGDSDSVYTFADSSISVGGKDIGVVQNFELRVDVNQEPLYELNSKYPVVGVHRTFAGVLNIGAKWNKSTVKPGDEIDGTGLDDLTITLTFTKSASQSMTITMTGSFFSEFSTAFAVGEDVDMGMVLLVKDVSVEVVDEDSDS